DSSRRLTCTISCRREKVLIAAVAAAVAAMPCPSSPLPALQLNGSTAGTSGRGAPAAPGSIATGFSCDTPPGAEPTGDCAINIPAPPACDSTATGFGDEE
ncbi:hypothetical protein Vretimale_3933, partial [Volvox reticuliferus]